MIKSLDEDNYSCHRSEINKICVKFIISKCGINNIFISLIILLAYRFFLVRISLIPFTINQLILFYYHFFAKNFINIFEINLLKGSVSYLNI